MYLTIEKLDNIDNIPNNFNKPYFIERGILNEEIFSKWNLKYLKENFNDNKFEIEGLNEFLANYHPESKQHNYDEIYALSKVVRDSNGIIIDDLHRTLPIMSKYEKTRILGQRAKQLNSGNKPFVSVPKNVMDGYLIAQEELMQKKLPFIIRRPLPNGGSEYWRIKDLEILY